MEMMRVLIVDDDEQWLQAIAQFLSKEKDINVAGSINNSEDAIAFLKQNDVDMVLLDINLSENQLDGIQAIKKIQKVRACKIVMMTNLDEKEVIIQSFSAGASNYVLKNNYKEIPSLLRLVHQQVEPMQVLVQDYHRLKEKELLSSLSKAEKEVFALTQKGYSQREICKKLTKTERTIKNQINSILKKTGETCIKDAVRKIKDRGVNL